MSELVLALDVGTHRIGVAVSDERRAMALPLETVDAKPRGEAVDRLVELIEEYDAGELVVGWPLDMSGTEGRAVQRVRRLVEALERRLGRRGDELPIHRWDERLTTSAADRLLSDADVSRAQRKEAVDQVAACKILEGFLAHQDSDTDSHP